MSSDFERLRESLSVIDAEHEVPTTDDQDFQRQIAGGEAPRPTKLAIRLRTTWFYFDRAGRFIGYGYAGYDEEEHFTARVQKVEAL